MTKCLRKDCGKEAYGSGVLCVDHEIENLREQAIKWREGYFSMGRSLGAAVWDHYYRGAMDERNCKVYDPAYGIEFYNYERPVAPDRSMYYQQLTRSYGRNK